MGNDASEVVVGGNGSIFVGAVGATVPADVASPLGAEWTDLGFMSEDGVTWTDGKTIQDIRAWQSFYAIRRIVTEREGKLVFSIMQWNGTNVIFSFGGGEIAETSPGQFEYTPPDPSVIDERAIAAEWQDGDHDFRLVFTRGMVSENVETKIVRTDAGMLPITFSLLGVTGEQPFRLQTNHPAFADVVGSGS